MHAQGITQGPRRLPQVGAGRDHQGALHTQQTRTGELDGLGLPRNQANQKQISMQLGHRRHLFHETGREMTPLSIIRWGHEGLKLGVL